VIYINGELSPTLSYKRRGYAYLGIPGPDGRDGTIFLNMARTYQRGGRQVYSSSYSVGEVDAVGFAGRAFVLDKLTGEEEHPRKPGDRLPPYQVRVQERTGEDGEVTTVVTCNCMATGCNAPCCRHRDLLVELLEQGAFDETQTEYDKGHGPEAHQRAEQEANRSPRDAGCYANGNGQEARRETPHVPELRGRIDDSRASANSHFVNQTEPLLTNARTISEFS
jgi:hypothetical protein